jgi:ubiquinone/menaquinone biosynthesis C-methylase UbiE
MIASADTTVQDAFSRQAGSFDAIDRANPLIGWVRDRVHRAVLQDLKPGMQMLEINAGSGIDSVFFAERGVHVLATDNAPGMVEQLRDKQQAHPGLPLEVADLSFHDLNTLKARSFDHVFSDLGGLNCTERLDDVLRGIDHVLRPGGRCTLVIMPTTSLWELAEIFRGNFRLAFRRRRKGGSPAVIEGVRFQCYYHDPSWVRKALPGWKIQRLMGLSVVMPPPHLAPFAARNPRLVGALAWIEDHVSSWPLLRSWGDHYLITLRKPK